MILYVVNGTILWWHEDASIKEEQFKDDENCIIVSSEINIPSIPQDGYDYTLNYDPETHQVSLVKSTKKELTHEELTELINRTNEQIQDDTLLGMELSSDTNLKVTTTGNDSLLLIELMMSIDEKLTQLLQPK